MKKHVVWCLAGWCLMAVLSGGVVAQERNATSMTANGGGVPDTAQVRHRMSTVAVPFEANTGQQDQRVAFTASGLGGTLFVTRAGVLVYSIPGLPVVERDESKVIHKRGPGWVLMETLVNANPLVRGATPSATHVSRFIGNDPSRWQPSIPTFDRVALGEAWPGIKMELAAQSDGVEKFFTVAPGADARRIAVRLDGAERLELAADGALVAHTGNGPVSFTAPRAWQDIKGERKSVRVAYALSGSGYGFHLDGYNPAFPVVIDPLKQSTYLGGNGSDSINAIAVNASGVYVTGSTTSTNFPGVNALSAQPNFASNNDAFVAELNTDLTALLHATYLGGLGDNQAGAIALDASGNVFVAGSTDSIYFPGVDALSAQPANGGASDAFVAKLKDDLSGILHATYLGGGGFDGATAITLDASNAHVYVAGSTTGAFPHTTGGAQVPFGGTATVGGPFGDAFVARLDSGLTAIYQATYLGGNNDDYASAIALDASGNVFVAGWTYSTPFPGVDTVSAQPTLGGGSGEDAFVAKLAFDLKSLIHATYLGGNNQDQANAIAVDASGFVFVAGITNSANFPATTTPVQTLFGFGGLNDAFVAKLDNNLNSIAGATFLGGNQDDAAYAIALDASGNVFVAGSTASTSFPGTPGGVQGTYAGGSNATGFIGDNFVARLNNNLTALTQATYLGGANDERANGVALDASGYVYLAGTTASYPFPGVNASSAQAALAGSFVAKLTHGLHDPGHATANDDGDPHITTTNGIHYNFQAAGEFTALRDVGGLDNLKTAGVRAALPNTTGLEIQTRQSPTSTFGPYWDGYTGLTTCVSLNTAVAARVGRHRVTYQPNFKNAADPSGLQLRVDGVLTPLTTAGLNLSGGGRVVQTGGALEIDFPDGTVLIATPFLVAWAAPQWLLNIDVHRTEATEGIMGAVPQGSWLPALPNGTTVGPMPAALHQRYVTLNQAYANAWRVSNATSLFDYAPGTSTATFTFDHWPAESSSSCVVPDHPSPPKPLAPGSAQKLGQPIADKTRNADCVFDVAVTGVPDLAKAYLLTQHIEQGATTITVSDGLTPIDGHNTTPVSFFTATVARLVAGGQTPIGTVQFMLDGAAMGKPVQLDAHGLARWQAATVKPGEHRLSARYLPNKGSLFLPSGSEEKVVVVMGAR
jgi:hypothetical protein